MKTIRQIRNLGKTSAFIWAPALAAAGFFGNLNNTTMSGLLDYYFAYHRILIGHAQPDGASLPTFPMWGYAFVAPVLGRQGSQIAQLGLYISLVVFLVLAADRICKPLRINKSLLIALLCLPSFSAIFATTTPYPVAIFFQTMSLCLYVASFHVMHWWRSDQGYKAGVRRTLICCLMQSGSGLLAGLTLNFRSDYMYFFAGLPLISLVYLSVDSRKFSTDLKRILKAATFSALAFYFSLFLTISPWIEYTRIATGRPLLGSTNTGHVFFLGLGQLPGNPWGITTADADPEKKKLLESFNELSSLNFTGDQVMREGFIREVRRHPFHYILKCMIGAVRVTLGGIYIPEFFENVDCTAFSGEGKIVNSCREFIKDSAFAPKLIFQALISHPAKLIAMTCLLAISIVSFAFSSAICLTCFLLLPCLFRRAFRERSIAFYVFACAISYQMAIGVFAFHMPLYMTNVYPLLAILLSGSSQKLTSLRSTFFANKLHPRESITRSPLVQGT